MITPNDCRRILIYLQGRDPEGPSASASQVLNYGFRGGKTVAETRECLRTLANFGLVDLMYRSDHHRTKELVELYRASAKLLAMPKIDPPDRYVKRPTEVLTTGQAAEVAAVSSHTITKWFRDGLIADVQGKQGPRLISVEDLRTLLVANGMQARLPALERRAAGLAVDTSLAEIFGKASIEGLAASGRMR